MIPIIRGRSGTVLMTTGRNNFLLQEEPQEPQEGAHPHMERYTSLDKMTFAVPSVTSKGHCPGKTGYTQISKSHYSVKKMFYDCCK